MNIKRSVFASAAIVGLTIAALSGATAASASNVEADPELTCSANYETKEMSCVEGDMDDLAEFLLEDQNVLLVDADADGRAEVANARAVAARSGDVAAKASYVLGVAFDGENYKGRRIVFNTSVSTTCSTHSFRWDDLNYAYWEGLGWASVVDTISSVQPGPGCKMWLYTDTGMNGSVYKATGNRATLGWANNMASSIWFTG